MQKSGVGVFIEQGLSDWQIVQHQNKSADISLSGSWIVPKAAIKQGVEWAQAMIRVVSEDDNSQIIPWQKASQSVAEDGYSGTWNATLTVPAGGLYRVETGLQTKSTIPDVSWMFRGDTRLHIGVGDVFLIGGQSNSAGYGKDTAFDPPALGVHLYRNRHCWDLASHPMNESSENAGVENAEAGVSGVSPYLSFGKNFQKLSHYPVGLIATAMGGMPMKKWEPGRGGLYRNMLAQAKACGPIAGVLWYQGCSDTDHKYAEYKERFYNMITAFRKDLGYEVPFFAFQLNRQINGENDMGWGIVRETQRSATKDFKDFYLLPTITCGLSDLIHNNAHSCILLGERMARLCAHVLYDTPAFFAPELDRAVFKGDTLHLHFANVALGFVVPSNLAKDSGFTITAPDGSVIPFDHFSIDPEDGSSLLITPDAPIPEGSTLSFAWEANPTMVPIMDEVTYLPPLSFYQYPIACEEA